MAGTPGLQALVSIPVVADMLSCDGTVYGDAVRLCFVPGADVRACLHGGQVDLTVYTRRSLRDITERHMYPYCVAGPTVVDAQANFTACAYVVRDEGGGEIRVVLSYVSDFCTQPDHVHSRSDFDVDLLEVDRLRLSLRRLPGPIAMHPFPLKHVLDACGERTFRTMQDPTTEADERSVMERISGLVAQGWRHGNARIRAATEVPVETACAICLADSTDLEDPRAWVALHPCGHAFHHRCLEEYAREATRRQPTYPRSIRCPLCRDSMHAYELCSVIQLELSS